jgi:phage terminase Nu1 subunit (DNA packaging protein)
MVDIDYQVTQQQFADLVGVSQQAISDLLRGEILTQGGTAQTWLHEYCSRLREQAAGRQACGDLDLATERAGLAKAQRERIEMQNAITRNELAPVYLLEEVLARAGGKVAKILDTIPGTIRRREPSLSAATIAEIARDVAKVRNIAAALTLDDVLAPDAPPESRQDDGSEQEPSDQ